jgi:hypothetical protein
MSRSCLTEPRSIPQSELVENGRTIVAHVGTVVFVALVEPEHYLRPSYPTIFPWQPPTSADRNVLGQVRLCPSHGASSLPVSYAAFRAIAAGRTTVSASLVPQWRTERNKPPRYRATVVVKR